MSSTSTKTLSVATTLAVVGSVAALGPLTEGKTPVLAPVSYSVPATTLHADALSPRTDERSTFAERASRDAADRAARLKRIKEAKEARAAKAKAAKAAKAAKLEAANARKLAAAGPAAPAGSTRAIGKRMAAKYGWTGAQWSALEKLWSAESSWRTTAGNRSTGAYGIPQAMPGHKMASAGSDWRTNPATQIEWGLNYIDKRWGTPANAWGHFLANRWY